MTKDNSKKVVFISSIGGMLEFYDFVIYLLLSPFIARIFFGGSGFYALLSTYIIFATGYFVRPIGGIIISHFGDKYGRKSAFMFTLFLMTFSTLFIACLPTKGYFSPISPFLLLIFRICQGFAVGGELPASVTFTFEHLPKEKRISGCSYIFAGNSCGVLLATIIVSILTYKLSIAQMLSWGWRPAFIIGAIIGGIGIYLRFSLSDTPAFKELSDKGLLSKMPFAELISEQSFETILCSVLTLGTAILFTSIVLMMPLTLNTYLKYPLQQTQQYNNFFLALLVISTVLLPKLVEKFKQPPILYFLFGIFTVCLFIFPLYYTANMHYDLLLFLIYGVICIATGLWNGISPYIIARCFPAKVRFSGFSTSYNLALAIGGGLTPVLITVLMKKFQSIYAIPFFIFASGVVCLLVLIILMIRYVYNKSQFD